MTSVVAFLALMAASTIGLACFAWWLAKHITR